MYVNWVDKSGIKNLMPSPPTLLACKTILIYWTEFAIWGMFSFFLDFCLSLEQDNYLQSAYFPNFFSFFSFLNSGSIAFFATGMIAKLLFGKKPQYYVRTSQDMFSSPVSVLKSSSISKFSNTIHIFPSFLPFHSLFRMKF